MDDLDTRYQKLRHNVSPFLAIQMGVCGFNTEYNNGSNNHGNIIAYPFNFYILPFFTDSLQKTYTSQISTMHFLSSYNFDFNKLYQEGIYYISKADELKIGNSNKVLKQKQNLREEINKNHSDTIAFMKNAQPILESYLHENDKKKSQANSEQTPLEINIQYMKPRVYKYFESYIKEHFQSRHLDFSYDTDFIPKRSKLIIQELSKAEYDEKLQEERKKVKVADIDQDSACFRTVIDTIIDTKAPILTHNGLLDIQHLYDKFIEDLPDDQSFFKQKFSENFGEIYDTKYMSANSNVLFNNFLHKTDLETCYKKCYSMSTLGRKIEIDDNFPDYRLTNLETEEVSFQHEAGFDAQMTGYVFLKSLEMLKLNTTDSHDKLRPSLEFYKNKLPLGGVKVPFNLAEIDDIYSDQNLKVFHCSFYGDRKLFRAAIDNLEKDIGGFNHWVIFSDKFEFLVVMKESQKEIAQCKDIEENGGLKICKIFCLVKN